MSSKDQQQQQQQMAISQRMFAMNQGQADFSDTRPSHHVNSGGGESSGLPNTGYGISGKIGGGNLIPGAGEAALSLFSHDGIEIIGSKEGVLNHSLTDFANGNMSPVNGLEQINSDIAGGISGEKVQLQHVSLSEQANAAHNLSLKSGASKGQGHGGH